MAFTNPTLDGNAVFGVGVKAPGPSFGEPRLQKGQYPGLLGTEVLTMGDNGAYSTVTGILCGATPGALASALTALRAFYDGAEHVLVDAQGESWPNCIMEAFEPANECGFDNVFGFTRGYTCRFFHQTLS